MDIAGFFTVQGRFSRAQFWVRWIVLVIVSVFTVWLPGILAFFPISVPSVRTMLELIASLSVFAVFYCQVCINAKRLHDMHRSGWLQAIPMVLCILVGIGGGTVARLTNEPRVVVYAGWLVNIIGAGFLIWIGVTPSDTESNRFGPPTGRLAAAEAFA